MSVQEITFFAPVHVGDEVSVFTNRSKVGRTPMHFTVEAWRRSRDDDEHFKVFGAIFTFVAIDSAAVRGPFRRAKLSTASNELKETDMTKGNR